MFLLPFVVKLLRVNNVSVCLNYHLNGKIMFDCLAVSSCYILDNLPPQLLAVIKHIADLFFFF